MILVSRMLIITVSCLPPLSALSEQNNKEIPPWGYPATSVTSTIKK